MHKLQYALICESVSVDSSTNQMSLFKIIEDMGFASGTPFPLIYPKFTLVMSYIREGDVSNEETVHCRLKFTSSIEAPAGAPPLPQFDTDIQMPAGKSRARVISEIVGIPLYGESDTSIVIQEKVGAQWETVHEVIVKVSIQPTPETGGAIPE